MSTRSQDRDEKNAHSGAYDVASERRHLRRRHLQSMQERLITQITAPCGLGAGVE